MVDPRKAERLAVPRALYPRFPFGRPFGMTGAPLQQRVLLEDALDLLVTATTPGETGSLPYRWRREDYSRILEERRASRPGPD